MFNTGDKVRLTDDFHYKKDDIGIITFVYNPNVVFVQFNRDNGNIYVPTEVLELIKETPIKGETMNTREAYQALLDGETLVTANGIEYKLPTIDPNERLMMRLPGEEWNLNGCALPYPYDLSIKPRTVNINGFDVPEPVRDETEFASMSQYYTPALERENLVSHVGKARGNDVPPAVLEIMYRGLVHVSRENARKHAEALLSFTKKD